MANRRITELQELAGLDIAEQDLLTVVHVFEVDPTLKNRKLTISGTKEYLNQYYLPRTGGTVSGALVVQGDLTVSGSTNFTTATFTGAVTVGSLIAQSGVTASGTISGATITGSNIQGTNVNGVLGNFTTITGGTINIASGNFLAKISGVTITGASGAFTSLTGQTITGTTVNVQTITGVGATFTTVTGNTAGFTTVTGVTVTGTSGGFVTLTSTTGNFTSLTGVTTTGTTATFTSGSFTSLTGVTTTVTSGIFALGTAAAPSITISGYLNTGIYSPGADQLAISTGGTGRIIVDASGNVNIDSNTFYVDAVNNRVGIGTPNPGSALDVVGTGKFTATQSLIINGTSGTYSTWQHNGTSVGDLGTGNQVLSGGSTGDFAFTSRAGALVFGINTDEKARLDTNGRLLVGTSSWSDRATSVLQGNSTDGATGPGYLTLSRGLAPGSLGAGTSIGIVAFTANNAGSFAQIVCEGDGASGTNDYPGRLMFFTTADGASSPTERMRITSSGNIITTGTFVDPAITGTILEDIYTITDGAAFEVDPGNGSIQLITLGASRTPKATNFTAGESVTLMVKCNIDPAYTITWTDATWGTGGVIWKGGTAPTLASTGYSVIQFWKVSTQVYGASVGDVA